MKKNLLMWVLVLSVFSLTSSAQFPSVKSTTKTVLNDWTDKKSNNKTTITSKKKFKDFELILQFSGSGEADVTLDEKVDAHLAFSFGKEASPDISGAVNGEIAPSLNASTESGLQEMRISFQKLDSKTSSVSVWLNGKQVQKDLKLPIKNPGESDIKVTSDNSLKFKEIAIRQLVSADHRKLLKSMDTASYKRGKQIYNTLCITCHGTIDKVGNMPTALRFAQAPFKNGADIVSMYDTIMNGFGMMVPQTWMKPEQVYDVIHFIREDYLKKHNKTQLKNFDEKYIASLPLPLKAVKGKKGADTFNYRDRKVYTKMNYGNSLSYSYQLDQTKNSKEWNIAYKGFAERLDPGEGGVTKGKNWIVFEKDTMRIGAVWSGSFIDYRSIMFDGSHGTHPKIKGKALFVMPNAPAWAKPGTESFVDTRVKGKDGIYYGPLTHDWARFKGRYIHGKKSVLRYQVGDSDILESFDFKGGVYIRNLNISKSSKELYHRVAPANVKVAVNGAAKIISKDGYNTLVIPSGKKVDVQVFMAESDDELNKVKASYKTVDNSVYTKGGPSQWNEILETQIKAGNGDGAYVVDEITIPFKNPWNSWMRVGGFDFYKDSDKGAICTWDGDVWTFSGLLSGQLKWKRMATGMFQPLGLKIINGKIFVTCRDQLALLHDYNKDGEADYIECYNGDQQVTDHFHEFAMGLQSDKEGNFYYAKSARHAKRALVPQHGTLMKISKDGSKTEILANGFRAANGVCLNPDGTFFVTDQEGHWTPKNRINWVKPNAKNPAFFGNFMGYHDKTNKDSEMDEPMVWLTQKYDRSPAELLWVDSDRWGPVKGQLLNISYGFGRIYVTPHEIVDGVAQGGVSALRIPDLPSGSMRGRFHTGDGQLYTAGLFAWASSRQEKPGGFWRIRYTGKEVMQPVALNASKEGLKITFSDPLGTEQNFSKLKVVKWHIKRSGRYGSKHEGEGQMKIESVKVLSDKKSIFIKIQDMKLTRGMEVSGSIRSASGKEFPIKISNTVNVIK